MSPPDPLEWIVEFFTRHAVRFPGQPWPDAESPEFAHLVEAWVFHFRRARVTAEMANRGSLALMLIPHFPNNHFAELMKAMPEPEVEYFRRDPRAAGFWKDEAKGLRVFGDGGVA